MGEVCYPTREFGCATMGTRFEFNRTGRDGVVQKLTIRSGHIIDSIEIQCQRGDSHHAGGFGGGLYRVICCYILTDLFFFFFFFFIFRNFNVF